MDMGKKILLLLRKRAFYIFIALCTVAIGLSITLAAINGKNQSYSGSAMPNETQTEEKQEDNKEEESKETELPISFGEPVYGGTVINDYSDMPVFNSTLERYSAHLAVDYAAEEGAPVYAVYDGRVESITKSYLMGYTIVIDHGSGLKTEYNSLSEDIEVEIGELVTKGKVIGSVSVSNLQELNDGAHLHFAVIENGEYINPLKYMTASEK